MLKAGSVGLLGSAALAGTTLYWWWNNDLLSPLTLPGPDRLVEAYSLTLSTLTVSVTTLSVMGILWLLESRERVRA